MANPANFSQDSYGRFEKRHGLQEAAMKASDVMTRTVTCIDEQASIAQALQLMLGQGIGGLPVGENQPMKEFAKHLGFARDMNPQDATEVIHTLRLN